MKNSHVNKYYETKKKKDLLTRSSIIKRGKIQTIQIIEEWVLLLGIRKHEIGKHTLHEFLIAELQISVCLRRKIKI